MSAVTGPRAGLLVLLVLAVAGFSAFLQGEEAIGSPDTGSLVRNGLPREGEFRSSPRYDFGDLTFSVSCSPKLRTTCHYDTRAYSLSDHSRLGDLANSKIRADDRPHWATIDVTAAEARRAVEDGGVLLRADFSAAGYPDIEVARIVRPLPKVRARVYSGAFASQPDAQVRLRVDTDPGALGRVTFTPYGLVVSCDDGTSRVARFLQSDEAKSRTRHGFEGSLNSVFSAGNHLFWTFTGVAHRHAANGTFNYFYDPAPDPTTGVEEPTCSSGGRVAWSAARACR